MKNFIIPMVISAPLLLSTPSFSAPVSGLYNPELRSNTMYSTGYKAAPQLGAQYAWYHWHHRHHRHHWHRWHHGHHWRHWHYW